MCCKVITLIHTMQVLLSPFPFFYNRMGESRRRHRADIEIWVIGKPLPLLYYTDLG